MRILAFLARVAAVAVAATLLAWAVRTDPIGPVPGRALSGEEDAAPPRGWDFTREAATCAVETRPADPWSVTTLCFTHDGVLYVPARDGSSKRWTRYASDDPRIRIKAGDHLVRAVASRVADEAVGEGMVDALFEKYPWIPRPAPDEPASEVWFFRIDPRTPGLAGAGG